MVIILVDTKGRARPDTHDPVRESLYTRVRDLEAENEWTLAGFINARRWWFAAEDKNRELRARNKELEAEVERLRNPLRWQFGQMRYKPAPAQRDAIWQ